MASAPQICKANDPAVALSRSVYLQLSLPIEFQVLDMEILGYCQSHPGCGAAPNDTIDWGQQSVSIDTILSRFGSFTGSHHSESNPFV